VTDGAFARQIITDQHAPVLLIIDCARPCILQQTRWPLFANNSAVEQLFPAFAQTAGASVGTVDWLASG